MQFVKMSTEKDFSYFTQIDANAFLDLKALTSLDLSHNKISILPGQTFSTLGGLKVSELIHSIA